MQYEQPVFADVTRIKFVKQLLQQLRTQIDEENTKLVAKLFVGPKLD